MYYLHCFSIKLSRSRKGFTVVGYLMCASVKVSYPRKGFILVCYLQRSSVTVSHPKKGFTVVCYLQRSTIQVSHPSKGFTVVCYLQCTGVKVSHSRKGFTMATWHHSVISSTSRWMHQPWYSWSCCRGHTELGCLWLAGINRLWWQVFIDCDCQMFFFVRLC